MSFHGGEIQVCVRRKDVSIRQANMDRLVPLDDCDAIVGEVSTVACIPDKVIESSVVLEIVPAGTSPARKADDACAEVVRDAVAAHERGAFPRE